MPHYPEPPRTFGLSPEELTTLNAWLAEHDKTCVSLAEGTGTIGGRLTYSFTPTSIYPFSRVKCACGAECDPTDYESI